MMAFSLQETGFFLPYELGPTARETLQEFIDIDVSVDDLVRILNGNQAYRDLFFRFVDQRTAKPAKPKRAPTPNEPGAPAAEPAPKKEQQNPTFRLIHLLGMLGTRNLILALRLHRMANGRFPVTEEGKIEITAGEYLVHALDMEDVFQRNRLEYGETAFAAAVYYDLAFSLHKNHASWRQLEPYFKTTWDRAFRTGMIAYFLAESIVGIAPKFALAAGMLAHAGKLPLAGKYADKPTYADFERGLDCEPSLSPISRVLLEREKLATTQEEIGAHMLHYFSLFQPLAPGIRYFREPYCLRGGEADSYRLAALLWLADNMARSWRVPLDEKDPVFQEWSYPADSGLKVQRSKVIEAMKRAMSLA